jgi:hypothetical protein
MLGPGCLGGDEQIVLDAWDILDTITPMDQLGAINACLTRVNGIGCYRSDSLMMAWIEAFWDRDVAAELEMGVDDRQGATSDVPPTAPPRTPPVRRCARVLRRADSHRAAAGE